MRVAVFALAGLVFGSFLTVVVHRVPRRESVVRPRSRCPRCGSEIRPLDNVPVVSYLALRGRCRVCGHPISPEYPITEVLTAGLFAAAAAVFDPVFLAVLIAPFLGVMLAVGLIDARWRIVPNHVVYPALVLFAATIVVGDVAGAGVDALRAGAGMAAYGLPLMAVALAIPKGMGMGDVKLAGFIGLVLGSLGLTYVAVAAAVGVVGGGVGGLLAILFLGYRRRQQIPFGPFLAGGAVVAALAAPAIAEAYLSVLSPS